MIIDELTIVTVLVRMLGILATALGTIGITVARISDDASFLSML